MRNIAKNAFLMRTKVLLDALLGALLVVLILSACGSPAATTAPAAVPTAAAAAFATAVPQTALQATAAAPLPAQPRPGISQPPGGAEAFLNMVTDPLLGPILVGENGRTLYIFTEDSPDTSTCDAACQKNWPPLITQGQPFLSEGVDPALVGSAVLADGSLIVTYNHMPLYYFYKDFNVGDTNGQALDNIWFVIAPDGNPDGALSNSNDNANSNTNEDSGYDMDDGGNSNSNQNSNDNGG